MNMKALKRFPRVAAVLSCLLGQQKEPEVPRFTRYVKDVLKGKEFEIGEYTYCSGRLNVIPYPGSKLKVGKFCSIAPEVTILLGGTGDHKMDAASTYPFGSFNDDWPEANNPRNKIAGDVPQYDVIIGNDVWVGYGATILSGVRIGDGAVIGASAVVTNNVEPYTIVAGNPACLIRKRFDDETIRKLLVMKWWDWPSEKIKRNVNNISDAHVSKLLQI